MNCLKDLLPKCVVLIVLCSPFDGFAQYICLSFEETSLDFFFEMCKKEPAEYSCLPKSQILFIAVYFQVCSLPVTTRIPEFTRIPENKATTIFSGIRVGIC